MARRPPDRCALEPAVGDGANTATFRSVWLTRCWRWHKMWWSGLVREAVLVGGYSVTPLPGGGPAKDAGTLVRSQAGGSSEANALERRWLQAVEPDRTPLEPRAVIPASTSRAAKL